MLPLLAALLLACPATAAQDPAAAHRPWTADTPLDALLAPPDGAALLARDARLSFPPRAGELAAAALAAAAEPDSPALDLHTHAAALLALGAARRERDRARLEQALSEPSPVLASAALLALGELGGRGRATIASFADAHDALIAASATLALERLEDPRAALDPELSADRALLELRWQAARRFGLVDQQRFDTLVFDALLAHQEFMQRLVLPRAAQSRRQGARDLVLQALEDCPGEGSIRAAVVAIPIELDALAVAELWAPADAEGWVWLVDEIGAQGAATDMLDTLRLALRVPDAKEAAAALLLGAGVRDAYELLRPLLSEPDPLRRRELARALGATRDPDWLTELARMRQDSDARVRAAALVGELRLGSPTAQTALREALDSRGAEERSAALEELEHAADDPFCVRWLEDEFSGGDGPEQLAIAVALAEAGKLAPRELLREALGANAAGELTPRAVRALARGADARDLEVLRALFPSVDDLELDLVVARALLASGAPEGLAFLRGALWREPWTLSALAGVLLVDQSGVGVLFDEIASAPPRAADRDLRRVGFALGLLGGAQEVAALARQRRPGDAALQGAYLGALAARTF